MKNQLTCGCCGKDFEGTKYQVSNAKYLNTQPYCSKACRMSDSARRRMEKAEISGVCPTCSKIFKSKHPKKYCSIDCYAVSDDLVERCREMNKQKKNDVLVKCECCNKEFTEKASRKAKFCSRRCYRTYYAERFDRWVASPGTVDEMQNYDEFLIQEELPCLVVGCDWIGKHLGMHMNHHHGITAREFKKMAGFNLKTGLVTPAVSEAIKAREHLQEMDGWLSRIGAENLSNARCDEIKERYISRESIEHKKKVRIDAGAGPKRKCKNCGAVFEQSTKFGRSLYCSHRCQQEFGTTKFAAKIFDLSCGYCGSKFKGNRAQVLRSERGGAVFCSNSCKGKVNGGRRRG